MENNSQKNNNRRSNKTPRNYWKAAFLIVSGLIIGCGIFLGFRLFDNREPQYNGQSTQEQISEAPTMQVQLKKAKVNQLISFYLNDFLKDTGINYQFYLEDQALLNGSFKILGQEMSFYLYFDPYVMEDGNIQLKAKSLSVGTLSLPISEIMRYIANNLTIPSWVEVSTKKQMITLHLDQAKFPNNLKVKAEKINLVDDEIQFAVYLPLK